MDEQVSEERKEQLIKEFSREHQLSELFNKDAPDSIDVGELAKEIGEDIWDII